MRERGERSWEVHNSLPPLTPLTACCLGPHLFEVPVVGLHQHAHIQHLQQLIMQVMWVNMSSSQSESRGREGVQ